MNVGYVCCVVNIQSKSIILFALIAMAFFLSACRLPKMIVKVRFNSCSVMTFACAIA